MTYLSGDPPWFAFIVHPRDMADCVSMPSGAFLRDHSESDEEFIAKVSSHPPVVVDEVVVFGTAVRGELIGVGRLPADMLTAAAHRAVVAAVELAVARGAPVVGLGALTAPVTAGGRALLRHLPPGVVLTNGNGLTAAVVRRNVLEASAFLGLGEDATVGVLGATGSVGAPLAHLLVDDGFRVLLVGPSRERVHRLLADLVERGAGAGAGVQELASVDIAVLLTSDPSAKLRSGILRQGTVAIDVAQPWNVEESELARFAAQGVRVVRGGAVSIPGFASGHRFGIKGRSTFACLAETYVVAVSGLREHSVGRPSVEYARAVDAISERYDVRTCELELGPLAHTAQTGVGV